MKKLIKSLILTNFITEFSVNTISCTKIKYDDEIWMISDGGSITDQSFNEFTYEGTNEYVNEKKPGYNASYYEVAGSNANDYITAYKIAKISKAKAIVLPGFRHQPFLNDEATCSDNNILLDASNNTTNWIPDKYELSGIYDGKYKTVVGVNYESEVASFEAGLVSFFYMNKNCTPADPSHPNFFKFATFGGVDAYNVYSYLWGLISASMLFNDYVRGVLDESSDIYKHLNQLKSDFQIIDSKSLKTFKLIDEQQSQLETPSNYSPANWFSGSFTPGLGQNISINLINAKADLILPAAGGQIGDTLYEAQKFNSKLKLIGVDSAQASIYNPVYTNLNYPVITSAQKDLSKTAEQLLTKLIDDKDKEWLGKTISVPLTPGTEDWLKIENISNIPSDVNEKILTDIKNIMSLECKYNSSNDLTSSIIEWFFDHKGTKFQDLLGYSSKFEDEIIKKIA